MRKYQAFDDGAYATRAVRLFVTLALCSLCAPALAQTTPPLGGMTDAPCPPQAPALPMQMRAALMKPGASPLAVPPAQMAAYRQVQQAALARDFADLCRYQAENAELPHGLRLRAVFMGDSITEAWRVGDPALFGPDIVDRGISGQTSPQMVLRFYQDVVALHPQVVQIMAGTNDIAGNTGPNRPADYQNNIRAMVDLARVNGIKVILASIPPTDRFAWQPNLHPAEQVRLLNTWLRDYARERNLVFADYYPVLVNTTGGMKSEFTNDGVHPTFPGYAVMRPVFEAALRRALASSQ